MITEHYLNPLEISELSLEEIKALVTRVEVSPLGNRYFFSDGSWLRGPNKLHPAASWFSGGTSEKPEDLKLRWGIARKLEQLKVKEL